MNRPKIAIKEHILKWNTQNKLTVFNQKSVYAVIPLHNGTNALYLHPVPRIVRYRNAVCKRDIRITRIDDLQKKFPIQEERSDRGGIPWPSAVTPARFQFPGPLAQSEYSRYPAPVPTDFAPAPQPKCEAQRLNTPHNIQTAWTLLQLRRPPPAGWYKRLSDNQTHSITPELNQTGTGLKLKNPTFCKL